MDVSVGVEEEGEEEGVKEGGGVVRVPETSRGAVAVVNDNLYRPTAATTAALRRTAHLLHIDLFLVLHFNST